MFCTSLRFCFKLYVKVQKVLMRWSNSPEIGLSSSFGHLFIPIEFFSPLTSARAQSTSWREILLHPPFLPPGDLQQGDENDDQLLLGQLDRCRPHGHCLGTLSQVLREYSQEYFLRKTDRAYHLWKTVDQSALCSLMKELSRKTDGADGEYFLPGETRGDFWAGGIWTKMNKYSLGCTKMHYDALRCTMMH